MGGRSGERGSSRLRPHGGLQETRQHAKCLRTTKDVRDYFRRYRQRKKGASESSGPQDSDDGSSGNVSETTMAAGPVPRKEVPNKSVKAIKAAQKPAAGAKASKAKKSKAAKCPPPAAAPPVPAVPLLQGGPLDLGVAPAVCSLPTAGMPPTGFGDLGLGSTKLQPLYEFGSCPGLDNNVVDQFLFPTGLMPSFVEPHPVGPPMELPKVLERQGDASLVRESSRDLESSVTIVEAASTFLHQNTFRGVGLETFPGDLFGV